MSAERQAQNKIESDVLKPAATEYPKTGPVLLPRADGPAGWGTCACKSIVI